MLHRFCLLYMECNLALNESKLQPCILTYVDVCKCCCTTNPLPSSPHEGFGMCHSQVAPKFIPGVSGFRNSPSAFQTFLLICQRVFFKGPKPTDFGISLDMSKSCHNDPKTIAKHFQFWFKPSKDSIFHWNSQNGIPKDIPTLSTIPKICCCIPKDFPWCSQQTFLRLFWDIVGNYLSTTAFIKAIWHCQFSFDSGGQCPKGHLIRKRLRQGKLSSLRVSVGKPIEI